MTVTTDISTDLTFTQADAPIILNDFVCSVCHSDLKVQYMTGESRIFIVCPEHGNVCLCGRVMRSSVSIQMERGIRDYYANISALPDLFGSLWSQGVPYEKATKLIHSHVCGLCGDNLVMQAIIDQNRKMLSDVVTLICRGGHGIVGLNGLGMVPSQQYEMVPPVEYRRILRQRAAFQRPVPLTFSDTPKNPYFGKLGVVTVETRTEEGSRDNDNFNIILFSKIAGMERKIRDTYGPHPAVLNIRLLSNSPALSFHQGLECYRKGALTARAKLVGNDWQWDYYRDPEDHTIQVGNGTAKTLYGLKLTQAGVDLAAPIYRDARNEPHTLERLGRLRFILPELVECGGVPIPGYFEMTFKDSTCDLIQKGVERVKKEGLEKGFMLPELPLILSMQKDGDGNQTINISIKE